MKQLQIALVAQYLQKLIKLVPANPFVWRQVHEWMKQIQTGFAEQHKLTELIQASSVVYLMQMRQIQSVFAAGQLTEMTSDYVKLKWPIVTIKSLGLYLMTDKQMELNFADKLKWTTVVVTCLVLYLKWLEQVQVAYAAEWIEQIQMTSVEKLKQTEQKVISFVAQLNETKQILTGIDYSKQIEQIQAVCLMWTEQLWTTVCLD